MLSVRLVNFKGFRDKTYQIPEKGIVLFDGQNGAGKTSLLEAISFALYDTGGTGCYPWQGKNNQSTSVHLTFSNGLNVYRQKRPALFRIQDPNTGIDLKDDSAKAYLGNLFGPEIGWLSSGYIKQLTVCHFLTMSANDKLEFLQTLFLLEPGKCEILLGRTHQLLNQANEGLKTANIQRMSKEQIYLHIYNQAPKEVHTFQAWSLGEREKFLLESADQEGIEKLRKEISQGEFIVSQNQKIKDQITHLNRELDNIPKPDLEKKRQDLTILENQLTLAQGLVRRNQLLISRNHLETKLSEIRVSENDIQMVQEYLEFQKESKEQEQIESALESLEIAGWNKEELETLQKEYPIFQDISGKYQKLKLRSETIEKKIEGLPRFSNQEEVERWKKQIQDNQTFQDQRIKIAQIDEQISHCPQTWNPEKLTLLEQDITLGKGKLVSCPSCHVELSLQDGQLVIHSGERPNLEELLQKKANLLKEFQDYQKFLHLSEKRSSFREVSFDPQAEEMYKAEMIQFNKFRLFQDSQIELQAINEDLANIAISIPEESLQKMKSRLSELLKLEIQVGKRNQLLQRQKTLILPKTPRSELLETPFEILKAQEVEGKHLKRQIQEIDFELSNTSETETLQDLGTLRLQIQELRKEILHDEKILTRRSQIEGSLLNLQLSPEPDLEALRNSLLEVEEARRILQHRDTLTQLFALYQDCQKAREEETRIQERMSRLTKIRETIRMSEYVILDTVLARINGYLEKFLSLIFPDPIQVRLQSLRKLKTQERIKPGINLEINYRGSSLTHPNDLSGGQYMRISLALTLAFSQLGRYPFLLLDESMSAIDVATRESIVEVLSQFFSQKLVCVVAHDTNEGAYSATLKF